MSQWSISIQNYFYKMDTSIRLTLLLIHRGVCLQRFYCIIIDLFANKRDTGMCARSKVNLFCINERDVLYFVFVFLIFGILVFWPFNFSLYVVCSDYNIVKEDLDTPIQNLQFNKFVFPNQDYSKFLHVYHSFNMVLKR